MPDPVGTSPQALVDDLNNLQRVADSQLAGILTAGVIATLQGSPLNPDASVQALLDYARFVNCLPPQEILALLVRKLLELLELLTTSGGISVGATITRTFDTLDEMLAANPATFNEGLNMNWDAGDGFISIWKKLTLAPPPPDNGDNVRASTFDGTTIYLKTFPA